MRTVLVPVDGSAAARAAVHAVAAQVRRREAGAIHLLSVQPPVTSYAGRFLPRGAIGAFQREEGTAALADARRILDEAGLPYEAHVRVGETAATIARTADELGADAIVLATGSGGWFARLLARLLLHQVVGRARVPVIAVKNAVTEDAELPRRGLLQRPA